MAKKSLKIHTKKRKNETRKEEDEQQARHCPKLRTSTSQQENSGLELSLTLITSNDNDNGVVPQSTPPISDPSASAASSEPQQARENPTQSKSKGRKKQSKDNQPLPPPYPWAKDIRAQVHTLKYLFENGIHTIFGEAQCKKCEKKSTIEYDVAQKFGEITSFIEHKRSQWHDRAPKEWVESKLPMCQHCGQQNSCKPVMSDKKKTMNWLFLLLGQLLGCCTLAQLKYFCKYNQIHRTGAKNRLLLYAYFALCKQLDPDGPFDLQTTTN